MLEWFSYCDAPHTHTRQDIYNPNQRQGHPAPGIS